MSYDFYKILHLIGLSLVVMSLGGVLVHAINGGSKATNSFRKGVMITHGVGLLLLLVAGFGMLARLGIHQMPGWVVGKLLIWLILGACVAFAYKQKLARSLWLVIPTLIAIAALLARFKSV